MHDLARITLENEMDLVLAHKRSMKLAEIAGLSLAAQTTFATAVSEVSRNAIEHGKNGCLILGISKQKKSSIVASIKDDNINQPIYKQGLAYAMRLVSKLHVLSHQDETGVELHYSIGTVVTIDAKKLDEWRTVFRNEAPLSAYDEIKRKNEQLQQLAQKLSESEDHYRELTDTLPLMMFSLNEEGDVTYINKWMSIFLGRTADELRTFNSWHLVHEDDRPTSKAINEHINQKQPITAEWRIKNKAGEYVWHMVSIHPLAQENAANKWFGFLIDINARKQFEQTTRDNEELKSIQLLLKDNINELNRSNEELQQFAYIASHDLQEPLRKIIFYTDYIKELHGKKMDDKSALYLQNMINASSRMSSMVSDLLAFSQVDRKLLNVKRVDLSLTLKKAVSTYRLTIAEKKAEIDFDQLPVIEADEQMIQRLFENILSNGLKYCKDDVAPVLQVRCKDEGNVLILTFEDNGIGFEEAFSSRIFGIFQRLHTREKYDGTGIGLAICQKIVEMHGGNIKAESVLGSGATFIITLPKIQIHS
jgi:PAS domain S-box-containing protein